MFGLQERPRQQNNGLSGGNYLTALIWEYTPRPQSTVIGVYESKEHKYVPMVKFT